MKTKTSLVLAALLVVCFMPALADKAEPKHDCAKPYRPYEFDSKQQLEKFNQDVVSYKNCIAEFIDEQKAAAKTHHQAASDAADEWNYFVELELQ